MLGVHPLRSAIVDWAIVLVLVVTAAYEVWLQANGPEPRWLVTLFLAAALVPLAWRRRAPLAVLVIVVAAITVQSVALEDWNSFQLFAAILLALFSAAAYPTRAGRRSAQRSQRRWSCPKRSRSSPRATRSLNYRARSSRSAPSGSAAGRSLGGEPKRNG